MSNYKTLPLKAETGFGNGRAQLVDEFLSPSLDIGYRPRFMWDVGASEQDITNIMEGIGGAGGYGSLSPPAMGYYGAAKIPANSTEAAFHRAEIVYPVNTDPGGCSKCQQKLSADDTQKNFIGVISVTVVLLLGIGAMYAIHNYT